MARLSRVAGRALAFAGFLLLAQGGLVSSPAQRCSEAGIIASTVAVTGLAVFDIATAPASVRRYNRGPVTVAPYLNAPDRSYGVSFSISHGRTRPVPGGAIHRSSTWRQDSVRPHKSPGAGLALSLGSTVVPMAAGIGMSSGGGAVVFLAGIVVGPSVGHFYAGQGWRGAATAGLRGAGTALWIRSFVDCWVD